MIYDTLSSQICKLLLTVQFFTRIMQKQSGECVKNQYPVLCSFTNMQFIFVAENRAPLVQKNYASASMHNLIIRKIDT